MNWAVSKLLLSVAATSGLQWPMLPASSTPPCDSSRTMRVLFVGNSYTYVNNVPRLVQAIASSLSGPCVESRMIASGGVTLEWHWTADSAAQRIRAEPWTAVVLQDQSTFGEAWAVDGRARVGTEGAELVDFVGRFAKEIKTAKARPILLAHWADEGAPIRDQQALDYAFANAARATGTGLSPVGEAIRRMRTLLPGETPYFTDGHHLSPVGSYLEALVLYTTIVDRSPLGAARRIEGPAVDFNHGIVFADSIVTLVDLSANVATALQRLAAEIHSERQRRIPSVLKPAPLADEFPTMPSHGDPLERPSLLGRWSGTSTVLPTPANQPLTMELVLHPEALNGTTPDSVYLRVSAIEIAGPVTWRLEGDHVIVQGTVTPRARVGRTGPPVPFTLELRALLGAGRLFGIATLKQEGNPSMPSFDGVGRFDLQRIR